MGISWRASFVLAFAVVGCGGAGATTGADASDSVNAASMPLLFEDHYSDTGGMLVYESGSGVVVQVYGGIGQDDPVAMGALLASGDLAHVYLKLHPEARSAPEALVAVTHRFAEDLSAAVRPSLEERGQPALTDKSLSNFTSNACQNFTERNGTWYHDQCNYQDGVGRIAHNGYPQLPGDHTFVWNEEAQSAHVHAYSWWGSVPFEIGYIAAWRWGWFTTSGFTTGGAQGGPPGGSYDPVQVVVDGVSPASLGITHHYYVDNIH